MLKVERRAVYHKGDGGAASENAWVVAISRHYVGGFHSKNNDGSNHPVPAPFRDLISFVVIFHSYCHAIASSVRFKSRLTRVEMCHRTY